MKRRKGVNIMKVELFLKNINQEMIDAGKKKKGVKGDGWVVSWPKECCILDFGLVKPVDLVSTPGFMLRSEKEGGMFWDPQSGSVYKVDEEGYHAMLELDKGFSEAEVARRMKVSTKKIAALTRKLRSIRKSSKKGATK